MFQGKTKTLTLLRAKVNNFDFKSSSKAHALSVLAPYFSIGCCGVIKPILSSTLDNIYIEIIIITLLHNVKYFYINLF